jgi:hypothetical protein
MAWHGMAWHGMAWHGMAWHGMAWHGLPNRIRINRINRRIESHKQTNNEGSFDSMEQNSGQRTTGQIKFFIYEY